MEGGGLLPGSRRSTCKNLWQDGAAPWRLVGREQELGGEWSERSSGQFQGRDFTNQVGPGARVKTLASLQSKMD